MQVNSAQDYLSRRKKQIIAATFVSTPPPNNRKYNYVFTAVVGNNAMQYERFIIPTQAASGVGGPIGGATFTTLCCLGGQTAPASRTTQGQLRVQDLNLAMSYRAT